MTIYEIKRLTADTSPYYFSRKTLRFFGQTMKSFKVSKCIDGRYKISADIRDFQTGKFMAKSERFFNPVTNKFENK